MEKTFYVDFKARHDAIVISPIRYIGEGLSLNIPNSKWNLKYVNVLMVLEQIVC